MLTETGTACLDGRDVIAVIDRRCLVGVDALMRAVRRPERWVDDRHGFRAWAGRILCDVEAVHAAQEDVLWPAIRIDDGPDLDLGALSAEHRRIRGALAQTGVALDAPEVRGQQLAALLHLASCTERLLVELLTHQRDEVVIDQRLGALEAGHRSALLQRFLAVVSHDRRRM